MTGTNSQSDQIQKISWLDLFLSEIVKYPIYLCNSMKYLNKKYPNLSNQEFISKTIKEYKQ